MSKVCHWIGAAACYLNLNAGGIIGSKVCHRNTLKDFISDGGGVYYVLIKVKVLCINCKVRSLITVVAIGDLLGADGSSACNENQKKS